MSSGSLSSLSPLKDAWRINPSWVQSRNSTSQTKRGSAHDAMLIKNKTLMPHPMHLHGHEFQVVEIDGKRFHGAVRDSVLVTPGTGVVIAFDANNPGWWAFHCHLLCHLDAGMFTTLRYV
jgi:FtsP/CotA-like multicopper oxidase with cupredoxin domain